jgi:uncharacterized protein YcgI (DUF1989 family)
LRVIDPLCEQVSDLVAFSRTTPRSWISSGKSIDFAERIKLTTGDKLYSNMSEVMMTIDADTVGCHDFLLAPCSQETFDILYKDHKGPHPSCLSNLADALAQFDIGIHEVPGAFNIFMNVNVHEGGRVSVDPPLSKAGDYIDLTAQMDLIIAMTACSAEMSNNFKLKPIHYDIRTT